MLFVTTAVIVFLLKFNYEKTTTGSSAWARKAVAVKKSFFYRSYSFRLYFDDAVNLVGLHHGGCGRDSKNCGCLRRFLYSYTALIII